METLGKPAPLNQAQKSLEPYVKTRQDSKHVRQVLAAFLQSQSGLKSEHPGEPLALRESRPDIKASSGPLRGIRKEYVRCLRANAKARQEYEALRSLQKSSRQFKISQNIAADHSEHFNDYLGLVKQKQKQERLRVLQDYLDCLAEKSHTLEPLQELSALLQHEDLRMPNNVVSSSTGNDSVPTQAEMSTLVHTLERSVLEAKANLKTEQQALQRLLSDGKFKSPQMNGRSGSKLLALSHTRDELITWIENELSKTGDSGTSPDIELCDPTNATIEVDHTQVKEHYVQYLHARNLFLEATSSCEIPEFTTSALSGSDATLQNQILSSAAHILPFLDSFMTTSKEQKSLIQQRTHLTTSLANQRKETAHTMDRLADESHLLPTYPTQVVQAQRDLVTSSTFADDMCDKGGVRQSDRAQSWIRASKSAATCTKDAVLEFFEEGSNAIEEVRQALATIDELLGRSDEGVDFDIWSVIDGNIGVLGRSE